MAFSRRLKAVEDQVMVITGASSGIGLATARLAAERGARLVLTAWDETGLSDAAERMRRAGAEVTTVVADVADPGALERVAAIAVESYGRIDTWINNAGIHLFGELMDVEWEDKRRIFDVNYWGMVHGARAAVPHLSRSGGVLMMVGSVLSSCSIPLQGVYTASKHAVKAYTDALRVELEADGADVVVTLIMPSAIHTPIAEHSKNILDKRAQLPPPLYDPHVVARAMLKAAEKPQRDVVVGGVGKLGVLGEKFAPKMTATLMKWLAFRMQQVEEPKRETQALHQPPQEPARIYAKERRFMLRHSLYTWAEFHPLLSTALAAAGASSLLVVRSRQKAHR